MQGNLGVSSSKMTPKGIRKQAWDGGDSGLRPALPATVHTRGDEARTRGGRRQMDQGWDDRTTVARRPAHSPSQEKDRGSPRVWPQRTVPSGLSWGLSVHSPHYCPRCFENLGPCSCLFSNAASGRLVPSTGLTQSGCLGDSSSRQAACT